MTHNIDFSTATSETIENSLGKQLEAIRLSRNITQSQLAKQAGVSRSTITRLAQEGKGISLDSFIRILHALQLHGHLQSLLPDPSISPLERMQFAGKRRQRARESDAAHGDWAWENSDDDISK